MAQTNSAPVAQEAQEILARLGVTLPSWGTLSVRTPLTGEVIAQLPMVDAASTNDVVAIAHEAFQQWRSVPAPKRGELVRILGEELRTVRKYHL